MPDSNTNPQDAVVAPVVPAVVAPSQVTVDALPPEALRQRLEQNERSVLSKTLASLGVPSLDEAKAAIEAHRIAKEAAKSDAEKLAALNLRVAAQAEALDVAVQQSAASLTVEQRAAVDAIAGADKAQWLKTYAALSPTWATRPAERQLAAVPQAPVQSTTTPQPTAAPASTAPNIPAPVSGASTSPPNHAVVYRSLQKNQPFAASAYLAKHGDACFKA